MKILIWSMTVFLEVPSCAPALSARSYPLTFTPIPAILRPRMENQTTNYDLSALDTEAMRSRLSELGSYL